MKTSDTVRMNFDIPVAFREQIRAQAKEYGMTSAQYCRMAILFAIGGSKHGGEKNTSVVRSGNAK